MGRGVRLLSLIVVAALWVAGLFAAPLWASGAPSPGAAAGVAAAVYGSGSLICHQRPERSFHRRGAPLPVCARCVGLYGGGLLGVLVWAAVAGVGRGASVSATRLWQSSRPRPLLLISAIPTAISVATAAIGWWDPGNLARALLTLPLGGAIGMVVAAVAAQDLR